jgi:hypothetical protein
MTRTKQSKLTNSVRLTRPDKATVVSTPQITCRGPNYNLDSLAVTLKVFTDGSQEVIDCPHLYASAKCGRSYVDIQGNWHVGTRDNREYHPCRYQTKK